jgi:hypothetical protein
MIKQHLDRIAPKQVKVARYDAWKYGRRELKRNFIDSLAHELKLGDKPEFSEGSTTSRSTSSSIHGVGPRQTGCRWALAPSSQSA